MFGSKQSKFSKDTKDMTPNELLKDNILKKTKALILEPSINMLTAPTSVEIKNTYIKWGGKYVHSYLVGGFPQDTNAFWFEGLQSINSIDLFFISTYITKIDNEKIIKKIQNKKVIYSYESTSQYNERQASMLAAGVQEFQELESQISSGRGDLYDFYLIISILSKNEESAKQDEQKLKKWATGNNLSLIRPPMLQMELFMESLPLARRTMDYKGVLFPTEAVGSTYSFNMGTNAHDNGVLYGKEVYTGALMFLNRFKNQNPHELVIGSSGSGKSFFVKLELMRTFALGYQQIVLDPENEYENVTKTLGGQFIDLKMGSGIIINPFDLTLNNIAGEDPEIIKKMKVESVEGLIKLILELEDKKNIEISFLPKFLTKYYEKTNPDNYGFITFHHALESSGYEQLADVLFKYAKGVYAPLLSGKTNVDFRGDIISFGLRNLESGSSGEIIKTIFLYIIMDYVWERVKNDPKEKFFIIDEAWTMLRGSKTQYLGDLLLNLVKRGRKYKVGMTVITQDAIDLDNNTGKAIINNTAQKVLLKPNLDENNKRAVNSVLSLNQSTQIILFEHLVARREALILTPKEKLWVEVYAHDQLEKPFILT